MINYDDLISTVKGEGVAYRGRVLLELRTVLGERPVKVVEDILHDDVLRVQVTHLYASSLPQPKYAPSRALPLSMQGVFSSFYVVISLLSTFH